MRTKECVNCGDVSSEVKYRVGLEIHLCSDCNNGAEEQLADDQKQEEYDNYLRNTLP